MVEVEGVERNIGINMREICNCITFYIIDVSSFIGYLICRETNLEGEYRGDALSIKPDFIFGLAQFSDAV